MRGQPREGSRTSVPHLLISPFATLFGSFARMPLAGLRCVTRGDFRLGLDRVVLKWGARGGGQDEEGEIRKRKDPDRPQATHYGPSAVPKERLGALGPRASAYFFLAGQGVKGVEGGGVGRGESQPAGRRQVLAQRGTDLSAASKLPALLGWTGLASEQPDPWGVSRDFRGRDSLPAFLQSGAGGPPYRQRRVALFVIGFYLRPVFLS